MTGTAVATSPVAVNGTPAGTGSIAGPVAVNYDGKVSPGDVSALKTVGQLTTSGGPRPART